MLFQILIILAFFLGKESESAYKLDSCCLFLGFVLCKMTYKAWLTEDVQTLEQILILKYLSTILKWPVDLLRDIKVFYVLYLLFSL